MRNTGLNIAGLKNKNRALLLNHLRKKQLSRAELSKLTGLTKPAVTLITNELIAEGILQETGTNRTERGRRPILLDIVSDFRYSVGVFLQRSRLVVSITDMKCALLDSMANSITQFHTQDEILETVCANIQTLLAKNKIPVEKLTGIGVSAPGPLNYQTGEILNPPNFEIVRHFPIVRLLKERFALPVCLENNAVLLALTENYYGCLGNYSNAMFIIVAYGIGSAILQNGAIYRGKDGFAGELGHMSVNIDGERCPCGNCGCLELYASPEALEKRFQFQEKDFPEIVDRAYAGDKAALEILRYEARYLAAGIVNAINLFDLDAVVLSGIVGYRPELLLEEIRRLVNTRSFISRSHKTDIIPSALRGNADVYSCSAAVLTHYFQSF